PLCGREVPVVPVSPCIGTHVGPAVGVAYECNHPIPGKLGAAYPALVYAS
ncbi:MAG TPA: DegV family protein, partial [Eggerthellaceae bacterium]|nr:DegV family protein [Eggerthellaceae bacterium]